VLVEGTFTSDGKAKISSDDDTADFIENLLVAGTNISLTVNNPGATETMTIAISDATLNSLAALGTAADKMAYTTALDTWAEADITAFGRSLIDDAAASNARTTLGLVIGTDVQAFDATLLSLAALGTAADKMAYTTALDTWAEADITAFGRSLIDDANAAAGRTTLGLGTIATQASDSVSITGGSITGITDLVVADGGTGLSSATAFAVLCGGTTSTAAFQSIASVGTSGQILTSNGAAALPTFQTLSAAADDVIVYAGMLFDGGGGPPTGETARDNTVIFRMQDAVNTDTRCSAVVPAGKTGISSITLRYISSGSSGNWYMKFETDHFDPAAAKTNDATDSLTTYADAATNNFVTTITVPAAAYDALPTMAAGDVVGIRIFRDGADANDTTTAAFDLVSVEFVWS